MNRVEELTLKFLDSVITDEELEELELLVASDEDAARRHIALMEQEAVLRGGGKPPDIAESALERIRAALESRTEERVLKEIHERTAGGEREDPPGSGKSVEPALQWFGSRRFWKTAVALLIVLAGVVLIQSARVNALHAEPQEAFLYGQWVLTPGAPSSFRMFVRNAETAKPIHGAKVRMMLADEKGARIWETESVTDPYGIAEVEPLTPDGLVECGYTLEAVATSDHGESVVTHRVLVKRSFRVLLTTDKPLYQPGQVIHMRTLSLATADLKPVAGREVTFEVMDPKGNKVFKKMESTSDFGIAAADFPLADQVNQGKYTVAAWVGDSRSERSVDVKPYVLPRFTIDLSLDKGFYLPSDTVRGEIQAQYTFGKAVAGGTVKVVASGFIEKFRSFAEVHGDLDQEGRFSFEVPLPDTLFGLDLKQGDAFVALNVTVTDKAGHVQPKTMDITVTKEPIRIEVIPESGSLLQNVENVLYIVTAYPDGRPARTKLRVGAWAQELETSSLGVAKVKITPREPILQLTIEAEDEKGLKASITQSLSFDNRLESILLRTDRAVYQTGDTVSFTVLSSGPGARVFIDIIKDRRTVLMKVIDMKNGSGVLPLDIPPDLFGTLEIHAYRILDDGNVVGDARIIQVNRTEDLKITAELDRDTYRPAKEAILDIAVRGNDGNPVQAALGLAGVDEAVFALSEMHPGFERVFFMLQEEILKPRYEIHDHLPVTAKQVNTLEKRTAPEREEAEVVLFASVKGTTKIEKDHGPTFARMQEQVEEEKKEFFRSLYTILILIPSGLFFVLILPVIAYGVYRFFRHAPVEGYPVSEMEKLGGAAGGLSCWWLFGLCLFPVFLVAGAIVATSFKGLFPVAIVVFVLVLACVAWKLAACTARLRRASPSASVPLFRKCSLLVPIAFACMLAGIAVMVLFVNVGREHIALNTKWVMLTSITMWITALVAAGPLFLTWKTLNKQVSTGRLFSSATIAVLVATLCVLLLWTCLFPRLGARAPSFMRAQMAIADGLGLRAGEEGEISITGRDTYSSRGEGGSGIRLARPTRVRRHFPETLLWLPELITDGQGQARVKIPLADSITTWRMAMSAVSRTGALGEGTLPLRVFQDFFVDIDFPVALTQNDEISVPVAVYNYLDKAQTVRLEVDDASWFECVGEGTRTIEVKAKEVAGVHFGIKALKPGRHALTLRAYGSEMADAVERSVRVEPDGRPVILTANGMLDGERHLSFEVPEMAIEGASDLLVKLYPGAFSQVMEGLDSIFRMPHGCFEQTSSITYPNVLALAYLRATDQVNPEIEMKALDYINLGYQRLLTFEVKGGGFEWFGSPPANVVLTAYGLLEFCDMAKVHEVDPKLIKRTRDWLFKEQQDDGSWLPPEGGIAEGAINRYQGAALRTTAYVAWALTGSGASGERVDDALDSIAEGATGTEDPYTLALCANALIAGGRRAEAVEILDWLDAMKRKEDGKIFWKSSIEGATHSRGLCQDIETTALAAYAFLKARHMTMEVHKALAWLIEQKDQRGTWHSTQATIHVMRALLLGSGTASGEEEPALIRLRIDGDPVEEVNITPETWDVFRMISLKDWIRVGRNMLTLELNGRGALAYQIVATHYLPWEERPVQTAKEMTIDVDYDTTSLYVDDMLGCQVSVSYNRPGTAQMVIVDLGIPPGFDLVPGSLESLKKKAIIERYSFTGRQAILYFRELRSGEPVQFSVELQAKYPVRVKTPRSAVYPYYEPGLRDETRPVEINVR